MDFAESDRPNSVAAENGHVLVCHLRCCCIVGEAHLVLDAGGGDHPDFEAVDSEIKITRA